jgi:hypothetical protein
MSIIAAGTTTNTALVSTGNTDGSLVLQTNGTTTAVTIDTSQNVGVGITPSGNFLLQAGNFTSTAARSFKLMSLYGGISGGSYPQFGYNFRSTATTSSYLYDLSDTASAIEFQDGFLFKIAASGTAGNAITFTQALALEKDKSLALQGATPQTGTGITFPATQSASSDANTLDDYEEGSFTFTGTGFTTSPTKTAYYTKIGNQVTVQIPDITGTSNTTAMTITGLPVALRSAQAYVFFALVYNNSGGNNGHIYGAHDNTVTVYWNAVSDAFTASGVKGITNNLYITYTLA